MNKNISSIQYNSLNLPSSINYQNGNMASYVYSAAGGKLSVSYQTGTGNTSTQYCGNIIYDNNNLSQVLIDGGYITFSGTTPQYHYYLQDHLGSNRVVVNESGTAEQVTHYYPFGGIIADLSTGQDIQKYRYNGKEFDKMHGLNTYDYGARQYYSILGRWDRVDPLCEKYYNLSPYNYCGGNPIKFIDPNGMWPWPWERGSLIEYRGNGVFGLRMSNFSGTTQRNFYAANNNPTNWEPGEIGISTVIGCIAIQQYGYQAYTPTNKSIGIDPKDGAVQIRRPIAVSTGQEDRRFHKFSPSYVNGRAGAGAMLALNIALGVSDTFLTLSSFWDAEAFTNQKIL
jgi:RHS repeat-associated protein